LHATFPLGQIFWPCYGLLKPKLQDQWEKSSESSYKKTNVVAAKCLLLQYAGSFSVAGIAWASRQEYGTFAPYNPQNQRESKQTDCRCWDADRRPGNGKMSQEAMAIRRIPDW